MIDAAPTTLPAVVPEPPVELTVLVTNYRPITDPDDLAELVGSDVDPDAFSGAVDGVAITDLRTRATLNDDGSVDFTLDIGTDTVASVQDRLKFDEPGLYPLRIQLLTGEPGDGNVVATAGTIVQRLPGPLDDVDIPPPVDLSVVTVTPSPGPAAPTADVVAAQTALDAAIDLAATIDSPMTLEVPPQLVADEAATEAGAQRLSESLENDELVALPIIPLDVSSAVAADRPDAFTRLVIAGEDLLTEAVPTTPTGRDVWITSDPLSAGGAQQLRDLGVRYVIMPSELYRDTVGGTLPATDLFVEAALPDGGTLPILVVDPLAVELTPSAADDILEQATPTEWAVETVAGILLEQDADDSDALPGRAPERSRILTTPDLLAPDARLLGGLEELVATTPSVRFALASSLIGVTDVQESDGEPLVVELPEVAGPSLTERIDVIDSTTLAMASAASMLSPEDARPAAWNVELDALISTSFSDAEVEAATAELLAEANAIKESVVLPEPFTFTLTGRTGSIDLAIGNTSDEPLTVTVGLDSTKVEFPEGSQTVTLRPNDDTTLIIPVEARSNGTSSIDVTVTTPAGEPLGDPVNLTSRVTGFTGLGQVLTAGFLLVLLTWWFAHWRARRRASIIDDGRESPSDRAQRKLRRPVTDLSDTRRPTPPSDIAPSLVIVTDSSCDLPADLADELGIVIVPLTIRFGDEEFIDRERALDRRVLEPVCERSDPARDRSARPGPVRDGLPDCSRERSECRAGGVVVIGAVGDDAVRPTRRADDRSDPTTDLDVRVVDSRTISMGLGTIALACARAAATVTSVDDVERLAHDLVERTRVFGALDTLDNLKKGGRIGNAKALLATALSIKPIIEVTGGVVEQGGKQRTRSKALAFLVDKVTSYDGSIENLAVMHADCSDVDLFVDLLAAALSRGHRRRRDRAGHRHPRRARHDRRRVPGHDDLNPTTPRRSLPGLQRIDRIV